jgi:hypothetical protein
MWFRRSASDYRQQVTAGPARVQDRLCWGNTKHADVTYRTTTAALPGDSQCGFGEVLLIQAGNERVRCSQAGNWTVLLCCILKATCARALKSILLTHIIPASHPILQTTCRRRPPTLTPALMSCGRHSQQEPPWWWHPLRPTGMCTAS